MIKNIVHGNFAYSKKYNYAIMWNAKSGCSFFKHIFYLLHKGEVKKHHSHVRDLPLFSFSNISCITNVRNPYTRTVSMFSNRYCGVENHLHKKFVELGVAPKKLSFRSFVKKLHLVKTRNQIKTDSHMDSQKSLSRDLKKFKEVHVARLENFNEEIVECYSKINIELSQKAFEILKKTKPINSTQRNNETLSVCDKEYSLKNTVFPHPKYFYDQELLEMVYDIYEDDFKQFGYEKYQL